MQEVGQAVEIVTLFQLVHRAVERSTADDLHLPPDWSRGLELFDKWANHLVTAHPVLRSTGDDCAHPLEQEAFQELQAP